MINAKNVIAENMTVLTVLIQMIGFIICVLYLIWETVLMRGICVVGIHVKMVNYVLLFIFILYGTK